MKRSWMVVQLDADGHLPDEIWNGIFAKIKESVEENKVPDLKIKAWELGNPRNRPCVT